MTDAQAELIANAIAANTAAVNAQTAALVAALNALNANFVAHNGLTLAEGLAALGVLKDYWEQLGFVGVKLGTEGQQTIEKNEHHLAADIVTAHAAAKDKLIQNI